jgi:hypothetical protein
MVGFQKSKILSELDEKLRAAGRHAARWHRANVVFVSLLAAAFGLFCAYVPTMAVGWIVFGFAAFAFLHIGSMYFQVTAPLVVESVGELHELRNVAERAQQSADYGASIAVLASVLMKFVETRTEIGVQDDAALEECVLEVLQALEQHAPILFSFERSEKWSFTVFIADANANLVPVKRLASAVHPRKDSQPRSWRAGDGHVGQAFQRRQTIVTRDATDPEVAALFRAQGANERKGDDELYRSYVSAPLGSGGEGRSPLGVLVVTSNVPGRFEDLARQPIELTANLLATVMRIRYRQ